MITSNLQKSAYRHVVIFRNKRFMLDEIVLKNIIPLSWNEKGKKILFKWSISLDNLIKFKPFISEECMHFDWFIVTFIVFGDAYMNMDLLY